MGDNMRLTTRPRRGQSFDAWRDEWARVLANREAFTSASALSGTCWPASTGRLEGASREAFYERRDHVDYTVMSYATPIAWHDDERGWTVPDDRYSVTTSHHQTIIRTIVARLERTEAYYVTDGAEWGPFTADERRDIDGTRTADAAYTWHLSDGRQHESQDTGAA